MAARLNFIFGFLGSGKTTLVSRILDRRAKSEKLAVIVNEFGDVGIDGAILSGFNVDMIELTSGCLCCTLKGSLMNAVDELIAKTDLRRIVIEATGVAQPCDLIETFSYPAVRARYDIGPIVTVIDSSKYRKLRDGLGKFYRAQVEFADLIVLNKVDIAPAAVLEEVRSDIAKLNSSAEIHFAERCDVDIDRLLDGPSNAALRSYAKKRGHMHNGDDDRVRGINQGDLHDHRHPPAESFVLDTPSDTARVDVESFFRQLSGNVWRAKGHMTIEGQSCLIQYSMGDTEIQAVDRRSIHNMVFIGQDMDRKEITERFDVLRRETPKA